MVVIGIMIMIMINDNEKYDYVNCNDKKSVTITSETLPFIILKLVE